MHIINMFHVILYIKVYFAQRRLCIVIVVNRRCDVSNAISGEISMGRKLAWVENCTGNYTYGINSEPESTTCCSYMTESNYNYPNPKQMLIH